jgi:hypothetical protein
MIRYNLLGSIIYIPMGLQFLKGLIMYNKQVLEVSRVNHLQNTLKTRCWMECLDEPR